MIGALVYYIGRANSPRLRVIGFFKGLVWPAMLVYEILKFLNEELPATQRLAPPQPDLVPSASRGEQTFCEGQGFSAQAGEKRENQNEEGCPKINKSQNNHIPKHYGDATSLTQPRPGIDEGNQRGDGCSVVIDPRLLEAMEQESTEDHRHEHGGNGYNRLFVKSVSHRNDHGR